MIIIPIARHIARLILAFTSNKRILVMCKGYNEDYDNFTELVWEDDKDLLFKDSTSYPEFQIWIRFSS
jgi:hypothetical protein